MVAHVHGLESTARWRPLFKLGGATKSSLNKTWWKFKFCFLFLSFFFGAKDRGGGGYPKKRCGGSGARLEGNA